MQDRERTGSTATADRVAAVEAAGLRGRTPRAVPRNKPRRGARPIAIEALYASLLKRCGVACISPERARVPAPSLAGALLLGGRHQLQVARLHPRLCERFDPQCRHCVVSRPHSVLMTEQNIDVVRRVYEAMENRDAVEHIQSQVVMENLFSAGDHVVQTGRTHGTVVANGATFDIPETHVWEVRDGKVVALRAYIDTPAMLEALGRWALGCTELACVAA